MPMNRTDHGLENALFDKQTGTGWYIRCVCGWRTTNHRYMAMAGAEFDAHLTAPDRDQQARRQEAELYGRK
jgi:hypothetical protein